MRLLTVAILLALAAPPGAAAATPVAGQPPEPGLHQVTLVTGDVVTFTDTARPTFVVEPATRTGATPVTFTGEWRGADFYVVPSDATARIAAGTVDRELFNVRALRRDGLSAGPLQVIVAGPEPASLAAATSVRPLPAIDGVAMTVDRTGIFWSTVDKAEHVWLDRRVRVSLDQSVPQIGAPTAWQGGHDGRGVRVAVLDTGVDTGHPDLAGKVAEAKDFTGEGPQDDHGHGTHVAATIAGGNGGKFTGVAPGATLVSGKVCGTDGTCQFSAILAGMDWAARSGARVVNISLGAPATAGGDPLTRALDRLTSQTGTLFVVAAGNDGCPVCVGSPATANSALAVGAVDKSDELAEFSSRGPRLSDAAVKPEIVAPGVGIAAAASGAEHVEMSGTSMATPHVTGAAALLAQAHPDWRWLRLKNALVSTAKDVGDTAFEQGAGRVDVPRAYRQAVYGPGPLNFGRISSGATRQLSYTNDTAAPVTLTLTARFESFTGTQANVGRLSTTTLTVPVRSTAAAFLTLTPFSAPPGVYSGLVTATSGSVSVRTAVSYYLPVRTAPVTVRLLDFAGNPVPGDTTAVLGSTPAPNDPFHTDPIQTIAVRDGVGTTLVPVGTYTAFSSVIDRPGKRAAWVVATNVTVRNVTEIVLDARKAVPATVSTEDSAQVVENQLLFSYQTPTAAWTSALLGRDLRLHATPVAPADGPAAVIMQHHVTLLNPGKAIYNVNYSQDDGIPATLTRQPTPADLIAINTRYHADRPGLTLFRAWSGFRKGAAGIMLLPRVSLTPPVELTEYVLRDERIAWTRLAQLGTPDGRNNYAMFNRGPFEESERWFEGPVAPAAPGFHRTPENMFVPTHFVNDSVRNHLLDVDLRGEYPTTWRMFHGDKEIPARGQPGFQMPVFPLPAEPGTFTLRSTVVLPPTAVGVPSLATRRHSPRVDMEWTFHSARAGVQPLLQLSHDLRLGLRNEAPANAAHTIEITAAHQQSASPVTRLSVAYSTDDGATWQSAPATSLGAGRYRVVITNPPAGGTVWLRTEAADADGNTVTQTVRQAYSTAS